MGDLNQHGKKIAGGKDHVGRNRHHLGGGALKSVLDEVKLLRSENESLHGDVDALKGDVYALKRGFKALLRSKGDPSPVLGGTGAEINSLPSDESNRVEVANDGPSSNSKKKKKKRKKKKRRTVANYVMAVGGNFGKIAAGASSTKIAVGLMSIALLISIALGQGILGKSSSRMWERRSGQSATLEKVDEVDDSAAVSGGDIILPVKVALPKRQDQDMLGVIKKADRRGDKKGGLTESPQELNVVVDSSTAKAVPTPIDQLASEGIVEKPPPSNRKQFGQSSTPRKLDKSYDRVKFSQKIGLAPEGLKEAVGSPKILGSTSKVEGTPKASVRPEIPKLARSAKTTSSGGASLATAPDDREEEPPRALQTNTLIGRKGVGSSVFSRSMLGRLEAAGGARLVGGKVASPLFSWRGEEGREAEATDELKRLVVVETSTATTTTTNFYPGYVCDADPETCGCPDLLQSDYRGTISKTREGLECEEWGASFIQDFPNAGLEKNFCRNPDKYSNVSWCLIDGHPGECEVPVCKALTAHPTVSAIPTSSMGPTGPPSSSSLPSSSSSPTQICPVADNAVCGCEVVQQSDYRGKISTTKDGVDCLWWDSELVNEIVDGFDLLEAFPHFEDNFCRNPGDLSPGCITPFPDKYGTHFHYCDIPKCDPCQCRPPCGQANEADCGCPSVIQANECCAEEDANCKCGYMKDACRKSLANETTDFCEEAEDACCEGEVEGKGNPYCNCNMYEQLCFENPSQPNCDLAAGVCCESEDFQCFCDFHTYSETFLNAESEYKSGNCSEAKLFESYGKPGLELGYLKELYVRNGGEDWIDNTGWSNSTTPHCQWFGLKCKEGLITEINLRDNNLTGEDFFESLFSPRLVKLDVAENKLSGEVSSDYILSLRRLVHIDISNNRFSGHADMLLPPSTLFVDFSNNNFTSASFKRFNPAYEALRVVDLSNNRIDQDALEMFRNVPPYLEELILSNNAMGGALPNPFPLENVRVFAIANNAINGALPDFPTPELEKLDLSNKNRGENGLSGTIPAALSNLGGLSDLNLAGNKLSGEIPSALGSLQLLVLNVSSNLLDKLIPSELGRLKDVLEVLDLSANQLTGYIPVQLTDLECRFHLSGNPNILDPAPLDLCYLAGFDLNNDPRLCPPERTALNDFYLSAKGTEWTERTLWQDQYASHCNWFGVTCSETKNTIQLVLPNNGLSGKLSNKIGDLPFLEFLDLSDNGMMGSIPIAIGNLTNLKYIRLCYNGFIGNQTNFGNLQQLELVQLHGNRLSGTIPKLNLVLSDPSSFVSDCGNPSMFEEALVCEECTMCCNVQGDCYPTEEDNIHKAGFKSYMQFSFAFIGCLFAFSGVLALAVYGHGRYQNRNLPESSVRLPELTDRDKKYALSTIGNDSVYQFFLGKSWTGWMIVLLTMAAQMWLLFMFVKGSEIDWTDETSALVYTYKCARDQDRCRDGNDLDWQGWLAFLILMVAHLMKDIIQGIKLIVLSGKQRHSHHMRMRFFIGGTLLFTVSAFTFYVSTIYNAAIATDNREIIENSVIILFICDIDELFLEILEVINEDWVEGMSQGEEQEEPVVDMAREEKDEEEHGVEGDYELTRARSDQSCADLSWKGEVERLKTVVATLQKTAGEQSAQLEKILTTPQDEHAYEHFLERLND